MKNDIHWIQRFDSYTKALSELREAVELSEERELSKLEEQGMIKAFDFTQELSWKCMKMSNSGLSLSVTEAIQSVFLKHKEVSEVVLYGSRAKGSYKKGSDIDLPITKGLVDTSLLYRLEDELDDLMLPYTIDLSIYEQIDNEELKEHIDRIGILFFTSDIK